MDYTKIQLPGEERKRTFARLMVHAIAPDGGFCGNYTTALNALDIAFKTRIPNLLKSHWKVLATNPLAQLLLHAFRL